MLHIMNFRGRWLKAIGSAVNVRGFHRLFAGDASSPGAFTLLSDYVKFLAQLGS